ncbi:hypothetical protein B0H34DRAFT_802681 [Crassisporium funariophilum]|nr:hypothetical protein B0H34DRAFT_802681 [Crassisporium funariophilum]
MVSAMYFMRSLALIAIAAQLSLAISVPGASPSNELSELAEVPPSDREPELEARQDVGRCHKGYCWAWCADHILGFWCYTTRGSTFDRGFVKCEKAYDCTGVYTCGGACGL